MKKRIIAFAAVLCLLLTGCAAHRTDDAFRNWDPQVEQEMAEEDWTYTLRTEQYPLNHSADDGRLLVEGGYGLPVMEVLHADGTAYDPVTESYAPALQVAQRFNDFFAEKMAAYQKDYDEVCRLARETYALGDEAWDNEDYHYLYTVEPAFRSSETLACVTMTVRTFTGGAHGFQLRLAYNFDMRTGQEVTIDDMTADYVGLRDAVAREILGQIDGKYVTYYEQLGLFDGYEEVIPEWMSRTVFFGEQDMKVVFGVYDIAPYSAGDVAFTIPYELIEPYLNDYGRTLLGLE